MKLMSCRELRRVLSGGAFIFVFLPLFSWAQPAASPEPSLTPIPMPSPLMTPIPAPILPPIPTPAPSPTGTPAASGDPTLPPIVEPTADTVIAPAPTPDISGLPEPQASPGPSPDFLTPLLDTDVNLSKMPTPPPMVVTPPPPAVQTMTYQQIEAETVKEFFNPKAPKMTIDDAIQTALKRNPDLLNSIQQIRLTRGQVIEVRAQALPQVALKTSFGQTQNSLTNPRGSSGGGTSTLNLVLPDGTPVMGTLSSSGSPTINDKSWSVSFQATQMIFNGAVIAGTQAAKILEDASYFSLRQEVDRIIAEVKIQFYQVTLNRALIVAQEQNIALLSQQLQDQQNRYEAGTVPRFNVLQAEVALANARPNLISARNNYRIAQYQLVKLLGMDYPTDAPSEVPFNVVGNLDYKLRKINADESIRLAIQRSPFLKAQRQDVLAQSKNLQAALSGYLPSIQAQANYTFENDQYSQDLSQTIQGWFWGITGNWNIFDGLATYGASAQAKAQLYQSKNTYDNSVRQVILDVQQSISNLQQARETIESQEASVTQATEALRLARERLDAGAGTQLDVLNAQVQLLTAQTTVLQARFDYIAALARYDQSLSLDTRYNENFEDPLTRQERNRYNRENAEGRPVPPLPKRFQSTDPIAGLTPAPTPVVTKQKAKPTPTPKKKKSNR